MVDRQVVWLENLLGDSPNGALPPWTPGSEITQKPLARHRVERFVCNGTNFGADRDELQLFSLHAGALCLRSLSG